MTVRQIIEQNQLPIDMSKGTTMSFLSKYVRDEVFGVGNPNPFGKVEENNTMVNDYPDELMPHVVSLIGEVIKKHPEWSATERTSKSL